MNQRSSCMTEGQCIFFVVTAGKTIVQGISFDVQKQKSVPVPVRSPFFTPSSRILLSRSRYVSTECGAETVLETCDYGAPIFFKVAIS